MSESGPLKYSLLVAFCFTQFLDAFNNSSLFAAIPPISADLNIDNSTSIWLISAYQLTFSALLLSSGRLSDLYNPKYVFLVGMLLLSFCALGAGFVRAQIPLIVLRAFMGIGAALNIPSAMSLIIRLFPEPGAQSKSLAAFAGAAAIGNVIGLILGAVLSEFASWPWVFYFAAILSFVLALFVYFVLPYTSVDYTAESQSPRSFKRLDLIGVSSLTIALILFVLALTFGSTDGWGTSRVIAPLILFVVITIFFFVWEARLPEALASIPPSMWKYQNFSILIAVGLQPFMWWASVQFLFSWFYQDVFHWSTLNTAVHFLPLGLVSFPIMGIASALQQRFPLKWVILVGELLVLAGTVLLPFADTKAHYWRFAFPGFCIGTAGMTIVFATTNIALFAVTPPKIAGTVGAIFTCALQLGSAAGSAIVTSIQTSVQKTHGGPNGFQGRAAGLWFLFAFTAIETLGVLIFMQNTVPPLKQIPMQDQGKENDVEKISDERESHSL